MGESSQPAVLEFEGTTSDHVHTFDELQHRTWETAIELGGLLSGESLFACLFLFAHF